MDAKKMLEGDPAAEAEGMRDALFQRLMVQVQNYSVEDASGEALNPEEVLSKVKKGGAECPELYQMLHIVQVQQLPTENDPNNSNLLDYSSKEKWQAVVEKQAKNSIA